MRIFPILAAVFIAGTAIADDVANDPMATAREAFAAEDWPTLVVALNAAQEERPYSLYLMKNRILAYVLAEDFENALALSRLVAERGIAMELTGHPALESFTATDAFAPIGAMLAKNNEPVGEETIVAELADPGLVPEALAYADKAHFVGSARTGKILKLDDDGAAGIAFANAGVFDLEVRGDDVWSVTNNQLVYENLGAESPYAAIIIFNKKTGAPKREIRAAELDAIFGDLEVSRDGAAYASDSGPPRIFKLSPNGEDLNIWSIDDRYVNLQGLALDEANNRLFVADYLAGLFSVDLETGEATLIANDANAHLGGIDGLYLYKNSLIGIQNGARPHRIVKIDLNNEGTAATSLTVLQQALPGWTEPTHGVIVGKKLHYVATANWPLYQEQEEGPWVLLEGAEPAPLRIMSATLE